MNDALTSAEVTAAPLVNFAFGSSLKVSVLASAANSQLEAIAGTTFSLGPAGPAAHRSARASAATKTVCLCGSRPVASWAPGHAQARRFHRQHDGGRQRRREGNPAREAFRMRPFTHDVFPLL